MDGKRQLYQGYGLQAVDKKGRLAVPGDLRGPLVENSGGERVLMIGDQDGLPCMVAYDRAWSDHLKAEIEADFQFERDQGKDVDRTVRALASFGNVERAPFDDAGRFILPAYVIDALDITDFAYFSGNGNVFHIWNPRTLIADERVIEGTRKRCAFEMKSKGIA